MKGRVLGIAPQRMDSGTNDFLRLRQDNLLYVDKTTQITEFLQATRYQLYTPPSPFWQEPVAFHH